MNIFKKLRFIRKGTKTEKDGSSSHAHYQNIRDSRATGVEISPDEEFFTGAKFDERITPDMIHTLGPKEIFVFGSNLEGHHAGGAARCALQFGAVMGQGVGLQGQSYAIPTMQGDVETIRPYVNEFIKFAESHPELTFLVTRIGCGIAGFRDDEIAPLFAGAYSLPNVHLPISFWKELSI